MRKKKTKSFEQIKNIAIQVGDTLTVYQKNQAPFTGIVIKRHGGNSPSATFTLRAVLSGVGVEKIFPLHSPTITKIERIRSARVRRAKLYFLRERIGKKAELKEKTQQKENKAKSTTRKHS